MSDVQIGDTFGAWTVIAAALPHPFRRGVVRWKVQCGGCEGTCVREQVALTKGLTQRCIGCRNKAGRATKARRGAAARHATGARARLQEKNASVDTGLAFSSKDVLLEQANSEDPVALATPPSPLTGKETS